jgi:predicted HD superfamily hydrolase involved in NAD metabolism
MSTDFDIPRADEYLALLRDRLPEKTFAHVQSVARYMLTFHDEAGCTREQAITAGLLHDVCKAFPKESLRAHAVSLGINEHLDNPNLLHGPAAAAECQQRLTIEDADVIEAIHYHTTGHAGWGAVGNALYFADFAEPLRILPEAKVARDMLIEQGFVVALRYVVERKVAHVKSRFTIDPETETFFDWIMAETV